MTAKPSAARIGAVTLAIVLAGSYVWFKSAQAEDSPSRVLPGSKSFHVELAPGQVQQPTAATAPATRPFAVIYSSKSAPISFRSSQPGASQPAGTTQPTTATSPATNPVIR